MDSNQTEIQKYLDLRDWKDTFLTDNIAYRTQILCLTFFENANMFKIVSL